MVAAALVAIAWALQGASSPVEGVGIDQKPGNPVPLDLTFRDEAGMPITLREAAAGKPILLAPVYYRCPQVCTMVLNGLLAGLKGLGPRAGDRFEAVAVSFDPREDAALAAAKKAAYLKRYDRPGAEPGWRFLTGEQGSINALCSAIGFRYRYDPVRGQFAHASALIVLTPDGRVSRYFFGIEYPSRDLRLAIAEAADGKSASLVDPLLLLCYQYDPATGRYGLAILRILRVLGIVTVTFIALGVWLLARRHRRSAALRGAPQG
ncbi:MAG TPA: SCO family protein [Planctomycetota bacterium]|jgi:protein SCO1/2|nr:SCO family protein [Planctomycetota bacterium]